MSRLGRVHSESPEAWGDTAHRAGKAHGAEQGCACRDAHVVCTCVRMRVHMRKPLSRCLRPPTDGELRSAFYSSLQQCYKNGLLL